MENRKIIERFAARNSKLAQYGVACGSWAVAIAILSQSAEKYRARGWVRKAAAIEPKIEKIYKDGRLVRAVLWSGHVCAGKIRRHVICSIGQAQ